MDQTIALVHLRASIYLLRPTIAEALCADVRAATKPGANGTTPALSSSRLNGLADTLLGTNARGDATVRWTACDTELKRLTKRLADGPAHALLATLTTFLKEQSRWEQNLQATLTENTLTEEAWVALLPTTRLLLAQTLLQVVLILAKAEPLLADLEKKGSTLQWQV